LFALSPVRQFEATSIAWGDRAGIEQVIGQLVSNAIKYSHGGHEVFVSVTERKDDIVIHVVNFGIELPTGPEAKLIWDFGFRGTIAKDMHVNGSGIGLFTVKKVITAHRGWVEANHEKPATHFYIHLPTKANLKRQLGVLL
jgi:signal transduction histidine kinase